MCILPFIRPSPPKCKLHFKNPAFTSLQGLAKHCCQVPIFDNPRSAQKMSQLPPPQSLLFAITLQMNLCRGLSALEKKRRVPKRSPAPMSRTRLGEERAASPLLKGEWGEPSIARSQKPTAWLRKRTDQLPLAKDLVVGTVRTGGKTRQLLHEPDCKGDLEEGGLKAGPDSSGHRNSGCENSHERVCAHPECCR